MENTLEKIFRDLALSLLWAVFLYFAALSFEKKLNEFLGEAGKQLIAFAIVGAATATLACPYIASFLCRLTSTFRKVGYQPSTAFNVIFGTLLSCFAMRKVEHLLEKASLPRDYLEKISHVPLSLPFIGINDLLDIFLMKIETI